jgi:hypothetical protein
MRKTLSVKPSDHIPDTEPYTLETMTVETGTLLGYKVITMELDDEADNHNEAFQNVKPTLTDWSGTYINKDILTALSYCPTKLEYCEKIQLVRISAKKDLTIKVCEKYIDDVKSKNNNSEKTPKECLKTCLENELGINRNEPILNAIGGLGHAFLSYDAEDTEIAFPHSLNHNDFLNIERIASFTTKEKYGVKEVRSINFNDGDTIKIPSGESLEKAVPKHSLTEGFPPGCY